MLGALKPRRRAPGRRGFTLIELLIAIAVVAIIATLAGPSFYDFILVQRLKSVNAQLVTDLQFARAEAAARNQLVLMRIASNESLSCYVIYIRLTPAARVHCDCRTAAESTCPEGARALRTVRLPAGDRVALRLPSGQSAAFGFDHVSGGIRTVASDFDNQPFNLYRIESAVDSTRVLRNDIGGSGRVHVCAPGNLNVGAPAC